MIIERKNYSPIEKTQFSLDDIQYYTNEQLNNSMIKLKNIINNYPISTFDLITLLRKHYNGNLRNSIENIPMQEFDNVRFNCLYQSKLMKQKLEEIGIKSFFLSYQAHRFALKSGDRKIKEAHVSVIVPTVLDDNIHFIIFDPGLKIDVPINISYGKENMLLASGNNVVKIGLVEDDNYPYYIDISGINKYSYNKTDHLIYQKFNPMFYTQNPDNILFPHSYELLLGYKATTFSSNIDYRCIITLNHLEKKLRLYDEKERTTLLLNYIDILRMGRKGLFQLIKPICAKLLLDAEEMIDNIFFMIDNSEEFIEDIMDKEVINEYENTRKVRIRK